MTERFDYFVVFAEMRTGSNFLEANLNALDGVACLGEAFNPHFIGYPNRDESLGVSQEARDAAPETLIEAVKGMEGLGGFRYFHDHDPRVLDRMLDDPRCAKIVLTRNPVESYVSWKIAQATGQWKLTNVKRRREEKVTFNPAEFERHLERMQTFQIEILHRLQTTGQSAFYVAYEDLQDVAVMNGLAAFLGVDDRLEALDPALKKQNPSPLRDKVENFDEMERAVARLDRFNLSRTPNFEPRRGASVPTFVAAAKTPLMYLRLKGGPDDAVLDWLAAIDGAARADLVSNMNQKALRDWRGAHPTHRSFTVLRHPLLRAHHAFCTYILPVGPDSFPAIRKQLVKNFNLPLPKEGPDDSYDRETHREAFEGFLRFLKANLNNQTGVRIDAAWASQVAVLQGMANVAIPDMLVREEEMAAFLPALAMQLGAEFDVEPAEAIQDAPFALGDIYDETLEDLARQVYARDYESFGFGPYWT